MDIQKVSVDLQDKEENKAKEPKVREDNDDNNVEEVFIYGVYNGTGIDNKKNVKTVQEIFSILYLVVMSRKKEVSN